jgi:hypothetical protein
VRAVRVAVRRAANEPSSRRDERKNYVETSEKATQPEPEVTQEPFTIRDTFGIGE